MSTSTANLWNSSQSKAIARNIANIPGLYCGPAVVGWIAAVWNLHKGRAYDYMDRLHDESLFPDGPRRFRGSGTIFEHSLETILRRETRGDLKLSNATHYRYGTIHRKLEQYDMPIIIRMKSRRFQDGLHYTALYKSRKRNRRWRLDKIKFYWMDNGHYGRANGGNPGLYATRWRSVGQSFFFWGSKRVVRA